MDITNLDNYKAVICNTHNYFTNIRVEYDMQIAMLEGISGYVIRFPLKGNREHVDKLIFDGWVKCVKVRALTCDVSLWNDGRIPYGPFMAQLVLPYPKNDFHSVLLFEDKNKLACGK